MVVEPVGTPKPYPISFGIFKGYKKTPYGEYTWGVYKNKKIEIYNATKFNQKLYYVSDNITFKWIKSKLSYFHNGIKRIARSTPNGI